jgi:hypothetical protein
MESNPPKSHVGSPQSDSASMGARPTADQLGMQFVATVVERVVANRPDALSDQGADVMTTCLGHLCHRSPCPDSLLTTVHDGSLAVLCMWSRLACTNSHTS